MADSWAASPVCYEINQPQEVTAGQDQDESQNIDG